MLLLHIKRFWTIKRCLELVSLPYFHFAWFWKKIIPLVMFYYLTNFHCLVAFNSWDVGKYVCFNCLLNRLRRQKFWNYFNISNQFLYSTWPKCSDKTWNILRTRGDFKMKWNAFFIISKGLSLKQMKQLLFGRWESDFKYLENGKSLSNIIPELRLLLSRY